MAWDLAAFGSWIILPSVLGEPSREDDIIVETIIRSSSNVIPVRILNEFFPDG